MHPSAVGPVDEPEKRAPRGEHRHGQEEPVHREKAEHEQPPVQERPKAHQREGEKPKQEEGSESQVYSGLDKSPRRPYRVP